MQACWYQGTASFQPLTILKDGDWREIYAHISR